MTVKQLIEKLEKLEPEKMIVVPGYEGGFGELDEVGEIQLDLNVNKEWYYGDHEESKDGECHAIFLR